MKEFITSDWHFSHRNICGEDAFVETRKGFSSIEEMNTHIISSINSVVTNEDTIYHLGDIGFGKPKELYEILTQIRGQIHLFKGNHDDSKLLKYIVNHNYLLGDGRNKFVLHEVGIIIKRNKVVFYLTHYPLGLGEYRRNMRSICGHIHDDAARDANVINVGIDSPELPKNNKFAAPIELDMAMELVNKKWEKWHEKTKRA